MTKSELRKQMIEISKTTSCASAEEVASIICNLDCYKNAKIILGYIALKSEVDVSIVMDRALLDGKMIAFPTEEPGIFVLGDSSWRENIVKLQNRTCTVLGKMLTFDDEKSIIKDGVILVPGLAFTEFGTRLGRGAGYYDQSNLILRKNIVNLTFIGICKHSQIVKQLPTEPHDKSVDVVLSF